MRTTENHQDKTDSKLYNVLTTYSFSLLLNEPCLGQEIFYIFAQQY